MKVKPLSSFLIALIVILTFACKSDDTIESFIITGDQSTVDYYFEFPTNEMTLISDEPFEDGRKKKYTSFFDLNDDSFNDLIFIYEYFLSNTGEGYYFLRAEFPSSIQLTGELTRAFNEHAIYPKLLPMDENIEENSSAWTAYNEKTHLFYFELNNHNEVKRLNVFPASREDVYLPFKINGAGEKGIGWIHIEPSSEAWRPKLLDIGYKVLD